MKKILNILVLCALPFFMSCRQEQLCPDYLNLDRTSYTFGHEGDTLKVKVDANVQWTVETDAEWLEYETDDTSAVFIAGPNDGAERSAAVSFVAEGIAPVNLNLSQLCAEFSGSITYFDSNVMMKYSSKGEYAVKAILKMINGLPAYEVYLIDNKINKSSRLSEVEAIIRSTADIIAVSDLGHILLSDFSVYYNGNVEKVTLPSDLESFFLTDISSDGTIVIGTARKYQSQVIHTPFKCINGKYEELPMPENNVMGIPMTRGVYVGGMSGDGSVIWGYDYESENYSSVNGLIYWKNGEMHYVGAESAEIKTYMQSGNEKKVPCLIRKQGSITSAAGPKVSPDGRYILAEYFDVEIVDGQRGEEYSYPARIDTETGEYTIFRDYSDMLAYTVNPEGEIFGASPYISAGYIAEDGIVLTSSGAETVSSYFKSRYGMVLSDKMLMSQFIPESSQYLGMKLTGKSMYGGQYQNFTLFTE